MDLEPTTRPTIRKIACVTCAISPVFPPAVLYSLYWSVMMKFTIESMGEISRYNILIGANVMLVVLPLIWWAGLWYTADSYTSSGMSFGTVSVGVFTLVFLLLNIRVVYRAIFFWWALPLK